MKLRSLALVFALALVGASSLFAQAVPVPSLWSGLLNNDGTILSPGRVYFYDTGTTTPKNVYDEPTMVTPRTYIDLDGYGRAQVYGNGTYRIVVTDRTTGSDVTLYTLDGFEVTSASSTTTISPVTAVIGSATVTYLTAAGGVLNSVTINNPTITNLTTTNPSITGGTWASATLTDPTISNPTFSGALSGTSLNCPTIVSPVITGTGTAVLASATIGYLTVTTLNAAGLTWTGIAILNPLITGATINSSTLFNPTFTGTTGGGTLKSLTLLEGPTSTYPGTAVTDAYVNAIFAPKQVPTEIASFANSSLTTVVLGSGPTALSQMTITNSGTSDAYYHVFSKGLSGFSGASTVQFWIAVGASYADRAEAIDLVWMDASLFPAQIKLSGTVRVPASSSVTVYLVYTNSVTAAVAYSAGWSANQLLGCFRVY